VISKTKLQLFELELFSISGTRSSTSHDI